MLSASEQGHARPLLLPYIRRGCELDESSVTQQFLYRHRASPADDRTRVLKHGPTFAVFDRYGDIETVGLKEQGIFCEGTRFLSQLELHLAQARPLLLSSTIKADNSLFAADLTNVDISRDGEVVIPAWHAACAANQISVARRLLRTVSGGELRKPPGRHSF